MVRVDTITFARRLRDSGVPADQAEAHAMAVHDYVQDFVTKDDLNQLRKDLEGTIDRMALRVTIRNGIVTGSIVTIATAILAALITLGA